ncbi:MAG: hypothetical protein QOE29_1849 [Gaiellaceae bacterium]|nr:hypothetical protein [Gaiellaceae bacterium]
MRKLCLSLLLFALAAPGAARAASASLRSSTLPIAARGGARHTRSFDLVGLHWRGSGQVRFSTHRVGGGWSAWHAAAPEAEDLPDEATPERAAQQSWRLGNPYWTGASDGIRYRLSGRVTALRAYFVRSSPASVPPRTLRMSALAPPIIPRAGWSAEEEIRRAPPRYADSIRFALVHHTAGSNTYTAAQSPAIVRAIELYHVKANGWNDIGYNFLVDKYGQVFEGRYGGMDKAVIGAHAEGFNTGSTGVAVLGNYGATKLTPAALQALEQLLAWRLDIAHVEPTGRVTAISGGNAKFPVGTAVSLRIVAGHRDTGFTSCPGQALYDELPAIAESVAQTGLPKVYTPHLTGTLGQPVRFDAKLSGSLPWTVTVTDANKAVLATGTGTSAEVDWTWDATAATEGTYHWTISTPGARSATGTLKGKPVAGGTAATVSALAAGPPIVTPNGDGVDDALTVGYTLSAAAAVTVTVASGPTAVATIFTGNQAKGAQQVAWAPPPELPDGSYTVTVATATSTLTAPFLVDRTLGQLAVTPALFSPNGDGRLDTTAISYQLAEAASVDVRLEQSGVLVADLGTEALQPGPQQLPWDGLNGGAHVPDGAYDLVVAATDPLATVLQKTLLTIDTTAPQLRLVSLKKLIFRSSERANVIAVVNGKRIALAAPAGSFRIPFKGKPRKVTLVATDLAGNRGRFKRP